MVRILTKISQLVRVTGDYEDRWEQVVATVEGDGEGLTKLAMSCMNKLQPLQEEAESLSRDLHDWPRFYVRTYDVGPAPENPIAEEERYVRDLRTARKAKEEGWRQEAADRGEYTDEIYIRGDERLWPEEFAERLGVSREAVDAVFG